MLCYVLTVRCQIKVSLRPDRSAGAGRGGDRMDRSGRFDSADRRTGERGGDRAGGDRRGGGRGGRDGGRGGGRYTSRQDLPPVRL